MIWYKRCIWSGARFAGGFGARDYRQTAAGGNAGGFGGRGGRNQGGHGGNRGFGGGEARNSIPTGRGLLYTIVFENLLKNKEQERCE